jgi:Aromatic acid exporter family member 1
MTPAIERFRNACLIRLRLRGSAAIARAARLTGAAVAAFVVAQVLFPETVPILAPLTALLVVEITLKDIVTSGVQRVASVTAGVLLAVAFSSIVGLSWWSLGALIAVSILLGQLLRLGPHMLEVPISAMLVLAVGGAEAAAVDRISETLIGAAVGVAMNIIFPPAVRANSAADAVQRFAAELAKLLSSAAAELREPITEQQATRWMEDARGLSRNVPQIDNALRQAENSRRLNPRALVLPDTSNTLRADLDALEHTTVAVRSMFRSILDGVRDHPTVDPASGADLRMVFAALLADLAATIEAFGDLAHAEGTDHVEVTEDDLDAALATLKEARDRIDDLLMIDPGPTGNGWELSQPVLQMVERVLRDLDIEERSRRRKAAVVPVKVDPMEMIKAAQQLLHPPRPAKPKPGNRRSPDRREIPADQTGPHRLPLGRAARGRDDSALETGRLIRPASRPNGRARSGPARRSS